MENQIKVLEDGKSVVTTDTMPIEDYLEGLARIKISVLDNIVMYNARLKELKKQLKDVDTDLESALHNKKTIIKKLVTKDLRLNNLLAESFPKEFKHMEKPKAKPQKVTTESTFIKCDRLVVLFDEETIKAEKIHCVEEFKTENALKTHIAKHKKNNELI